MIFIAFLSTLKQTTPSSERKTVLVLNTNGGWKAPVLVDAEGRQDGNIVMLFGKDTEVHASCSLSWRNQFFVFGGWSQKRQISQLVGCELSRVGTLDFDHSYGGCTNVADDQLYLCFNIGDSVDYKKCRVASDPMGNFTEVSQSAFEHRVTRVASSNSKFLSQVIPRE